MFCRCGLVKVLDAGSRNSQFQIAVFVRFDGGFRDNSATAEAQIVAVENKLIFSRVGSKTVLVIIVQTEIYYRHYNVAELVYAFESYYAVLGVVRKQPFEAVPSRIVLIQRLILLVRLVELRNKMPVRIVLGIGKQLPIELALFAPLVPLRKLYAHKTELFAGMRVLETEKCL